jgi:hypothetical protein
VIVSTEGQPGAVPADQSGDADLTRLFFAAFQHFDGDKVLLDLDLEWDGDGDPEHFLQHYIVKRWIEIGGGRLGESPPCSVKRADKLCYD